MKKLIYLSSIIILVGIISGCATLFAPQTRLLSMSSEPMEADVFVNGFKMGVTPVKLNLKANKPYTIEFRKEGYQSITRVIKTKVNAGWIVLDVLGGLFPVFIDGANGAWNKFDQETVNAVLEKQAN